jgi:hypothetical protein
MLTVLRNSFVPKSEKATANGIATLDESGKVPAAQLPSYVDDVLEYANRGSFPSIGETGKIYIDMSAGKTYRWSGSQYIEISNAADILDDTKGEGDEAFTWTANKLHSMFTAEDGRIDAIANGIGVANGIATLDGNAKVPNGQLQNIINDASSDSDTSVTWSAYKLHEAISSIKERLDNLEYLPISINSLTVSPSLVEDGSTVSSAILNYTLNKNAKRITLDGAARPETAANGTITLTSQALTRNKTWALTAIDERNQTASRSAVTTFTNKVKYGAASLPSSINDSFLNSLPTRTLSTGKVKNFSVTAGAGQYIWYALPSSYGTCSFAVNGFTGGFSQVAVFNHQNESGKVVEYRVYRSDNAGLGAQSISVS